jgi:arylsulfatase A-like enzyme
MRSTRLLKQTVFKIFSPKSSGMVRRSRSIPLPEPASLTNSLKICERCRLALGFYLLMCAPLATTAGENGAGLSGFKIMTSEGGTRAPLVIRYPKKVTVGERTDAFASVLDIVPTLLDLAGVQPSKNLATLGGRTMVPLLDGSSKEIHDSSEVFVTEIAGNAAVYRGDYKLVRNLPPFGDKQWHLYNIRVDPTESNDLSSTNPDLVEGLTAAYADYIKKHNVVEVPDGYSVIEQAKKNMAHVDH